MSVPPIDLLESHLCTSKEILTFLKTHPTSWVNIVRAEVEKSIRQSFDKPENELQRMIDEDVLGDVELFTVPYITAVQGPSEPFVTCVRCIPLITNEPNDDTKIWKGTFAFLIQGEALYALVKDLAVVTLQSSDENDPNRTMIAEARHLEFILKEGL